MRINYFECCYKCVAPKRYPGCSGKCPEYVEARAKFDADKARANADSSAKAYTYNNVGKIMDSKAKRDRNNRGHKWFRKGY